MARNDAAQAGPRGSRELWLDAAYRSLVDSGIDAVRIQPLGKAIRLSRTSFYWFFVDRDDLLDALLGRWRDKNTGGLVRQARRYADSLAEAVLNVFDCWLDPTLFDARFEFAVRSWGLQSSQVGMEIEGADAARLSALADVFARFGFDASAGDVRARSIYLTQIGYISMNAREDLAIRLERIPHYVEVFTGTSPTRAELARFQARHQGSGPRGGVDLD